MVRIPVVTQDVQGESGPVCLTALARAFGQPAEVKQLRTHIRPDPDPHSALDLCTAARARGIMLHPSLPTPEDLAANVHDLQLPAILVLRDHHYVVADKVRQDGALRVMDPAEGRRWISREELRTQATGMVLAADGRRMRIGTVKDAAMPRGMAERVLRLVRRDVSWAALAGALLVIIGVGMPAVAGDAGRDDNAEAGMCLIEDSGRSNGAQSR